MIMNNNNSNCKQKELDKAWAFLEEGIAKMKNLLEGRGPKFTSAEHTALYTTVYNISATKHHHEYSQQLYDRYRETLADYIRITVLPAVRERQHDDDESMLRELVKRWNNHKIMSRWLTRIFNYLDRYFIPKGELLSLSDVGLLCFRDGVYADVKNDVKDAVIALIARERDGEQIDRALLENVLEIFVEMGMGKLDAYEGNFEAAMLADTTAYYSRKAASWIDQDSYSQYTLKAEECLKREKERAGHYFPASSEPKLMEIVQHELFTKNQAQLLAKQKSGGTLMEIMQHELFTENQAQLLAKQKSGIVMEILQHELFTKNQGQLLANQKSGVVL